MTVVELTSEGDWYVARSCQPEVASQGATVTEALDNLREALSLYFREHYEDN